MPPRHNDNLSAGFVDHHGRRVISPQYAEALDFSDGLAATRTAQGNWLFIDKDGTIAVKPEAKLLDVLSFSDGLAPAQVMTDEDTAEGSIQSWSGSNWGPHIAPQASGRKWGFIDRSGGFAVAAEYDSVGEFREGLAPVLTGKKWGYIDRSHLVIPLEFDEARVFSNGLAAVRKGKKFGFIDKTGAEVIPFQFDQAYDFNGGVCIARLDGALVAMDSSGKRIADDFDAYQSSNTGLFTSHALNSGPQFDSEKRKFRVVAAGGYLVYKKRTPLSRAPVAYMDKDGDIKVEVKLPDLSADAMIFATEFQDKHAVICIQSGDSIRYFICDEFGNATPVDAYQVFSFREGRARILANHEGNDGTR